mmetsp:Transcript_27940/g.39434  ORF Transcript_27940/g.39434 Transcript_27940/m.39434 type:complete len:222 (-) Transcript_27940:158-823(-)
MNKCLVLPSLKVCKTPATVIVLHGLGDSGHGWSDAAGMWQKALPHCKFVLPHAPKAPVTLNFGMMCPSWHDIKSLDSIDSEDFAGLDKSIQYVQSLIAEEVKGGTPAARVVLGGFSQGAALSIMTGFATDSPLAGVFAMSGYMPYKGDAKDFVKNTKIPSLLCHGSADQVVKLEFGQNAYERLQKLGVPVDFKLYSGMEHSACIEEIEEVATFLKKLLPED